VPQRPSRAPVGAVTPVWGSVARGFADRESMSLGRSGVAESRSYATIGSLDDQSSERHWAATQLLGAISMHLFCTPVSESLAPSALNVFSK
jgi:hypothetical protein